MMKSVDVRDEKEKGMIMALQIQTVSYVSLTLTHWNSDPILPVKTVFDPT